MVYELTRPSNLRTRRMIAMVSSMFYLLLIAETYTFNNRPFCSLKTYKLLYITKFRRYTFISEGIFPKKKRENSVSDC